MTTNLYIPSTPNKFMFQSVPRPENSPNKANGRTSSKATKKYQLSGWDLSAIAPKNLKQTMQEIEIKTNALAKKRKLLTKTTSAKTFLNFLKQLEEIRILSEKLGCYAHLKFSENSADQKAVAQMSQIENFLTAQSNKLLFFNLWFKELSDKKANELIKASGNYNYYFKKIRKRKPFTLQENEEKIINIKDTTGVSALNNIYNILTSQFTYKFKGKEVTQNELIQAVRDPNAKIREQAYKALLSEYKKHKDVIGEIYKNIINDWREENVTLRKYKTPISVRNSVNDVPDKAIEALLNVCKRNEKVFHKFFVIKAKKLGLKKLKRFDIYAPIKGKEAKMNYHDAIHLVLETFGGFHADYRTQAEKIIHANHVHSKPQKNKYTGAYCCSVTAKQSPFVLLSYTGIMRDVSTLAHELGHGVHHNLAANQTEFTNHSCLPLAETASIFSEMLLSEKLMQDQPKKAKEMIFAKLDDLYASITRQAGFVMFEKKSTPNDARWKNN